MAQAVRWDLIADPRRFQRGFKDAERTADSFSRTIHRVGGLVAGAFAGISVVQVFKGFLDEGREAQKVGAQTAAVIKSTGAAAGLTAKGFENLAGRLSKYAAIDDEVIQGGENILATFTRIKAGGPDQVFERASKAALDMAASMGHGKVTADNLQSANLRLGKALNDPLKGMTALTRVGVTFSDQQREQIKNFVEAGDTAKAQGVILDEVAKEFGGSAGAAATGWDRFKVSLGNFQEFVGTALIPIIDRAGNFLGNDLIPQLQTFATNVAKEFGPALGSLTDKIQEKFDTFSLDAKIFGRNLAAKVKGITQAIIIGFQQGLKTGDWSQLSTILGNVLADAIGNGADLMVRAFGGVDWVNVGKQVGGHAFGFAVGFISALFTDLFDVARKHPLDVALFAATILPVGKISGALSKVVEHIPFLRIFAPMLKALHGLTEPINRAIGRIIRVFGEGFAEGFGRVFPRIGKLLDQLLQGQLIGGIRNLFGRIRKAGRDLIHNLAGGIGEEFGTIVRNIAGVISRLVRPFRNAAVWLISKGRALVSGLVAGIRGALGSVGGVLRQLRDAIVGGIKRLFGIHSPSTVMAGLGGHLVAGLVRGLIGNAGSLRAVIKSLGLSVTDWFASSIGGLLGGFLGTGNIRFTGGPIVDLARNMAAQMGWVGAQWAALYQIVAHESGWNPNAQNPTSTAYGLFQFLNSTWAGTGIGKTSNPALQIAAGLNYIRQAYGDPVRAWAFWQGHHWYGEGGVFSKPSIIGVGERGPEAVVPLDRLSSGIDYGRLAAAIVDALERRPPVVRVDDIHTGLLAKKGRRLGGVRLGLE